ncbi:MAG TPA: ABC transporter substrate-binding protein [Clostridiaceae bacterium]|jgi:branched-chain amino acid transport system substrate-binding protein|nr:ABC transporter substrate-binding protein [Clostridiaceae bacterium]
MKKIISVTLLIALTMTLISGCGGSANANEIRIGINYELSGEVASYGQASVEGIELAIEEINAAGGIDGKEIKAIKYDNKSDKSQATTLATKLMTQDKVVAVLGPATSGAFKATIPEAIKNKVVVASGSATADDVTVDASGVKEYAFRICFTDSYQGTAMANYALNNMSATKAAVIMDNSSDYAKGLAANFTQTFEAGGGTVVATEAFVAGDTDFNAILTKIKGQDFDVIFLPGYYEEAGLIIRQARDQGIDTPILGADGFGAPELVELAGADALNDVFFSSHFSSLDKDPSVIDFIENFKAKYGKEPDQFAALGYDLVYFIADGIKRAGNTDTVAIKDALAATKDFAGITGSFSMDENHNPVKAVVVVGIENGVHATSERVAQ